MCIRDRYYGYEAAVIDLRNPTRSDGNNLLHLVNQYMDQYQKDTSNLAAKAKAEKYAKITSKTIINSSGGDAASYGQNAYFYDAAEGLLTAVILLIAEYCPPEKRHIISVFKLSSFALSNRSVLPESNAMYSEKFMPDFSYIAPSSMVRAPIAPHLSWLMNCLLYTSRCV